MKLVDLHVHSTCSDGTLTPSELVSLAKKTGLSAFALTDHDTVKKASRFFPALSFPRNTREKIFIS